MAQKLARAITHHAEQNTGTCIGISRGPDLVLHRYWPFPLFFYTVLVREALGFCRCAVVGLISACGQLKNVRTIEMTSRVLVALDQK